MHIWLHVFALVLVASSANFPSVAEPNLICRDQAAEYIGEENSPGPADANGKATSITRYIWQVDCFKVKDQQAKATGALMIASDVTSKLTATDRFWKCVSPTKYSSAPCYARCCYVKP